MAPSLRQLRVSLDLILALDLFLVKQNYIQLHVYDTQSNNMIIFTSFENEDLMPTR